MHHWTICSYQSILNWCIIEQSCSWRTSTHKLSNESIPYRFQANVNNKRESCFLAGGSDAGLFSGFGIAIRFITALIILKNCDMNGHSTKSVRNGHCFDHSHNLCWSYQDLGNNYSAQWILNATALKIKIINTTGAAPPAIGILTVSAAPSRGLPVWNTNKSAFLAVLNFSFHQIRTADGKSVGSHPSPSSPPLTGSFGPSNIEIVSVEALDLAGTSSAYHAGDAIKALVSY